MDGELTGSFAASFAGYEQLGLLLLFFVLFLLLHKGWKTSIHTES